MVFQVPTLKSLPSMEITVLWEKSAFASSIFVHFVSFVVREYCAITRGTLGVQGLALRAAMTVPDDVTYDENDNPNTSVDRDAVD